MIKIRLPKGTWSYDPNKPLGPPGGFGAVFQGLDSSGQLVAVKRLHVDAQQAGHRELAIAAELMDRQLPNVVPILDAGQDADTQGYFVVMPIAETSLEDHLKKQGPMSEPDAVGVLLQIVNGLESVAQIVHRDLKPGNILLFNGNWCIADFGIARFVEESTSTQTLKDCLSPLYAAPEQWRLEHATSATDIYALGCIGYALLNGKPPFQGAPAQLHDQHLRSAPPELPNVSPQMKTLLNMLLRKPPEARPGRQRTRDVLRDIERSGKTVNSDPNLGRLAAAAARHESERAEAAAQQERVRAISKRRNELAAAARATLVEIFEELARRITQAVPSARVHIEGSAHRIQVGSATLEIDVGAIAPIYGPDAFPRSKWDVICGAAIEVEQAKPLHKRAASLWYTKKEHQDADYRWYEVGYEGNPLTGQGFKFEPAAVTAELADRAHSHAMDVVQASYPPIPIDDESLDAFCRRWAHILAEAADGRLQNLPRSLPPNS